MSRATFVAAVILLFTGMAEAQHRPTWRIHHYDLEYEILPSEHVYRGAAALSLESISDRRQTAVTLGLYRLQDVEIVEDMAGQPLQFVADVVKAPDRLGFQAVKIVVQLSDPVGPGGTVRLRVRHAGPMLGYRELMRYTKDSIDENFSLLRMDTLAYPVLGPVTERDIFGNIRAQIIEGWTFRLGVTVPQSLVVAASGRQLRRTEVDANRWHYEFESVLPTWRIDVAVADYEVLTQPEQQLKVYVLRENVEMAEAAMEVMAKVIKTFRQWFGAIPGVGYTLIEIPEGYGSQASTLYFLQTTDALKDKNKLHNLAHEIAHAWNVPSREEHVSRFLDEAFATYFQALVDDVLEGPGAKQRRLESYRQRYLRRLESHPEWGRVAIADYGRRDLGDLSYVKGPWVLAVIDEIVGHDTFKKLVRTFLARYQKSGATLQDFRAVAEEVSGRKLDSFWAEWIEQGEPSTLLLQQSSDASEMAARYR